MLDIEFVGSDRPIERPIIYLYRTGHLRDDVLATIASCAGQPLIKHGRGDLHIFGGGLLHTEGLHWCDWAIAASDPPALSRRKAKAKKAKLTKSSEDQDAAASEKQTASIWSAALEKLGQKRIAPTVHFIGPEFRVKRLPIWRRIARTCTIVEEGEVTPANLRKYTRYLIARSELKIMEAELQSIGFFAKLSQRASEGVINLNELSNEIDLQFLTHFDPVSRERLNDPKFEASGQEQLSVRSRLRQFLLTKQTRDLALLVWAVSRLRDRRRWNSVEVMRELYRCTSLLFRAPSPVGRPSADTTGATTRPTDPTFERHLILWSATLLAWERRVSAHWRASQQEHTRAPDVMIVCLDQLARDYLSRCRSDIRGDDPIVNLWAALEGISDPAPASARDPAAKQRARLLQNLAQPEVPAIDAWMNALRRAATRSLARANRYKSGIAALSGDRHELD